jgi:hypothetical protein
VIWTAIVYLQNISKYSIYFLNYILRITSVALAIGPNNMTMMYMKEGCLFVLFNCHIEISQRMAFVAMLLALLESTQ